MYRLRRPRSTMAIILTAGLSFVAAACSSDDDSADALMAVDAAIEDDGITLAQVTTIAEAADFAQERATANPMMQSIQLGRDIIYTADLTVAVSSVEGSEREAIATVASLGGFLFGQESTGLPEPRSLLIFKVPPERFEETLQRLGELGTVRSQNVSAADVTERVVDLESRIKSAQASVERLNTFLAAATDVKSIAELEAQLLERETVLETLRGQLRTLRDRVDYATVSVALTEALSRPALLLTVTAYPGADPTGAACPGEGGLSVVENEAATVCFEIANTGDTPLRDFAVSDPVLDVSTEDLFVVFGDPSATLLPGQSLVLATGFIVERATRTQTTATATPVDEEGRPVEARSVASVTALMIAAEDPGGLPGFKDGLSAGAEVIGTIGGAIVLSAGVLLPLLPVILAAGLFVFWRRRRHHQSGDAAA